LKKTKLKFICLREKLGNPLGTFGNFWEQLGIFGNYWEFWELLRIFGNVSQFVIPYVTHIFQVSFPSCVKRNRQEEKNQFLCSGNTFLFDHAWVGFDEGKVGIG
jgi:hypothetical protein